MFSEGEDEDKCVELNKLFILSIFLILYFLTFSIINSNSFYINQRLFCIKATPSPNESITAYSLMYYDLILVELSKLISIYFIPFYYPILPIDYISFGVDWINRESSSTVKHSKVYTAISELGWSADLQSVSYSNGEVWF